MDLTDRPADAAVPQQLPPQERAGGDLLARALRRARWTIFWERLWPALASITTVIGLFLALSWLGLWLWLPPAGRAIGLGIFFLLTAAAFAPVLMLRVPSRIEGLRRLDRNSGLPHRPATAIADEIAAPTDDSFSVALWRAGRPPVILPGLRPGEPVQSAAALSVPAGSVLLIRATGIHLDVVASGGLAEPLVWDAERV